MIAISYIIFFIVYFIVSLVVVLTAMKTSKKLFGQAWMGAIMSGLLMYSVVFWDWLPVLYNHKNLCRYNAGVWEYKAPEKFIEENPQYGRQVWDSVSLRRWENKKVSDNHSISKTWLNDLFYLERDYEYSFVHGISRLEQKLVNADANLVLLKSTQFKRGDTKLPLSSRGLTDYKFWLAIGENVCHVGPISVDKSFNEKFNNFIYYVGVKGE